MDSTRWPLLLSTSLWRRFILIPLAVLALVMAGVGIFLSHYFNNEQLAQFIMKQVNASLKGRLEIHRVHWSPRVFIDLLWGSPTPVVIEHFAIHDPQGKSVLEVPKIDCQIELLPLIHGKLLAHKIQIHQGRCLIEEKPGLNPQETEIGFIQAFAPVKPSPPGQRGWRIELQDFTLNGIQLGLHFIDWSLDLDKISTGGSFILTGGDIEQEGILYQIKPRAPSGRLTILGYPIPLQNVQLQKFEVNHLHPMDLAFALTMEADKAPIAAHGKLTNIYRDHTGVDLTLSVPAFQEVLSRKIGYWVKGPGNLVATIKGPIARPIISGRINKAALQCVQAREMQGQITWDTERGMVDVSRFEGKIKEGQFNTVLRLAQSTGLVEGQVTLKQVGLESFIPNMAIDLNGTVNFNGMLQSPMRSTVDLKLDVQPRRKFPLPGPLHLEGKAQWLAPKVNWQGITISGAGNILRSSGEIDVQSRQVNARLDLHAPRLAKWLSQLHWPVFAESGRWKASIRGPWLEPKIDSALTLSHLGYGKLRAAQMTAQVTLDQGVINAKQIRVEGFDGQIKGEARLKLFDGPFTRPLSAPPLSSALKADAINASLLSANPKISGMLSLDAQVQGTLFHPEGKATLKLTQATLYGNKLQTAKVDFNINEKYLEIKEGFLRQSEGGEFFLAGKLYLQGPIDLHARAKAFPLRSIPSVSQLPLPITGILDGNVHLFGSIPDPKLEGKIQFQQVHARGLKLGAGELILNQQGRQVQITGRLGAIFQLRGDVTLSPMPNAKAHQSYWPNPKLKLMVQIKQFPLEKMLHEILELGDVQGVIDGQVDIEADALSGLTHFGARLSTIQISLRQPAEFFSRQKRSFQLINLDPLVVLYNGHELQLKPVRFSNQIQGPRKQKTEFSLGGRASLEKIDIWLKGRIMAELGEFFLASQVKRLSGDIFADIRVNGPLSDLNLAGQLLLRHIGIQLPNFERPIEVARGQIKFASGKMIFQQLTVKVEQSFLTASGEIEFQQLKPHNVQLAIKGDLDLKLLQLFFPEYISNAGGIAWTNLHIFGPILNPQFSGNLQVKYIEFSPRGWGRNLTLLSGDITFSNSLVKTTQPLKGIYDDGNIRVDGEARFDKWDLADLYLKIKGTGIPHREPKAYTAEADVNLILKGDSNQLFLEGDVILVDARYTRSYDFFQQSFLKPRVYEEDIPFWKGTPLLENLQLQLQIKSAGQVFVRNNLAQLSLSGGFLVKGPLIDPRLDGQIRIEEGTFRIPWLRGEYTINRGDISFDERKLIEQGEINLVGETLFSDRNSGVEYQIRLTVQGPLSHLTPQLSSNPPLSHGQIASLMAFGRTTDQLRQQLGGGNEGGQGSGSQAAGAADAQVKQLTGEILSQIVEEPLKKIFHLDLIRLQPGTESAQFQLCEKLGRYVDVCGEAEKFYQGDTRAEGRVQAKIINEMLMLIGKWERLPTYLDTYNFVDTSPWRMELKLHLPLR